ncbi:type II secretion system F family protein [Thalassiella azotivora]
MSELASLLAAGLPAARAWAALPPGGSGPWGRALADAAQAAARGGDIASALRASSDGGGRRGRDDAHARARWALAAAWEVADRSGAPPAEVLERLAEALRRAEEVGGARDAALAGPRATARLLAWLPAGGLLVGELMGASPLAVLVGTPAGRLCALLGGVLTAAGAVWTRSLVRAAERS